MFRIQAGMAFGELALMQEDGVRSTTVVASVPKTNEMEGEESGGCTCIAVSREVYKKALEVGPLTPAPVQCNASFASYTRDPVWCGCWMVVILKILK